MTRAKRKVKRRVHSGKCSGRMKTRSSGIRCDCGARWECY